MDSSVPNNIVTVPEAIKRLGDHAPSRQTLYAAVKNGKIEEAPDTPNANDKKIRILWPSVEAYMASRKRKTRGNADRKATTNAEAQPASPPLVPANGPDQTTGNEHSSDSGPVSTDTTATDSHENRPKPKRPKSKTTAKRKRLLTILRPAESATNPETQAPQPDQQ